MKRTIRPLMFETNSSSTHTIVILSKEDMEKWQKPGMRLNENTWEVVTEEEAEATIMKDSYWRIKNSFTKEQKDSWFQFNGYFTADEWAEDEYLEVDSADYVTKSGDEIVVLTKYGFD